jgi:hypothetical protein
MQSKEKHGKQNILLTSPTIKGKAIEFSGGILKTTRQSNVISLIIFERNIIENMKNLY